MSTQVVELSGDEAALLRSLDRVIQKELEHERSLARMAGAGDQAGLQLESAMQRVQAANEAALKASIRDLAKLGPEGKKAAEALKTAFAADGKAGFPTYDALLAKIESIDPATAEVVGKVKAQLAEADRQDAFDKTLEAMKRLGGASAAVAAKIQTELRTSSDVPAAFDEYLAQLTALHPEAAAVAERVKAELAEADRKDQFDSSLKSLREIGPAGTAIANKLADEMKAAAAAAAGGIDGILAKMKELDPTVEAVAAKVRLELEAADRATKFDASMRELERINPVAAKAAKSIREQMDLADAGVKFDNIIAELEKVDPKAAAEAKKLRGHMKTAADEGTTAWTQFSTSAVTQIGAVAGAYLGVQEAIAMVNQYLVDQEKLLQSALDKQLELAKAQQEASKNLAAYNAVERDELLQQAVPEIIRTTGFSDAAQLTLAVGEAASAGASPEQAKVAAAAAARMNRLTPDKVADAAAGTASIMLQTGLSDPRQAASLLATAGPLSKVGDADRLAKSLPKALGNVATAPQQETGEAARQVAALFGVATNRGVDSTGDTTATFVGALTGKMASLFQDLENRQIDARSKVELIDRKIAKGTDTEANRRDRSELLQFLDETKGMKDPGTIFGRLEAVQANPGIQRQLLGDSGRIGEEQFQVVLREFLQKDSEASQSLRSMADAIRSDVGYFEQIASEQASATPQLRLGSFQSAQEASIVATDAFNNEGASLAALRESVATTLERTRSDGALGFISAQVDETGIRKGRLAGGTFAEESIEAINTLRGRLGSLEEGGITREERPKVLELTSSIEQIRNLVADQLKTGAVSSESGLAAAGRARDQADSFRRGGAFGEAEYFINLAKSIEASVAVAQAQLEETRRQNELMQENNDLLSETADNTRPTVPQPTDYNAVQTDALANEDAR